MTDKIPDLTNFDATLGEDARQKVETSINYDKSRNMNFSPVKQLKNKGILSPYDNSKGYITTLKVENPGNSHNPHRLCNYDNVVASASYVTVLDKDIGCIGLVNVKYGLRGFGIGTQLKKIANNHMIQDGVNVIFTYVASKGGKQLAKNTGYVSETDVFYDNEKIWYYNV